MKTRVVAIQDRSLRTRHLPYWGLVIAGLCVLVVFAILRHDWRPGHYDFISVGVPMPSFDAYLTWQDYDPWSVDRPLAGAVFIWNGRKLGRGKPADNELLRELKAMPIGSRVLVYPRYEEITPYPMQRLYPNPIYTPAFNRVLAERRLTIIFSPYDHLGRICPDAYDGVHLPPEAPPDRLPAASTGPMPSTATSSAPP